MRDDLGDDFGRETIQMHFGALSRINFDICDILLHLFSLISHMRLHFISILQMGKLRLREVK